MKSKKEVQNEALSKILLLKKSGVEISMGVGKTLLGLKHMEYHYNNGKRKFLVVAPKRSVINTWKEEAIKFKLEYLLDCIDFTTYISLNKKSQDYDITYLDECHNLLYSHDEWLKHYDGIILGLTGTKPRINNSEKGIMVSTYCPIVYQYKIDDAIDSKILNDYKIYVHRINLDQTKTLKVTSKKGSWYTSEQDSYDFWTNKILNARTKSDEYICRIMRMKVLMSYTSKERYTKRLLKMIQSKCIVFANTHIQADSICEHSFHSKNKNSEYNLELFKQGKITKLSTVLQLNEGANIPDLEIGIILHAYSNERKSSQRLGRLLRLSTDKTAILHILCYRGTVDEEWVTSALKDLDQTKITWI